ncbi:MAG: hypothetical protein J0H08_09945 [Rhizobiales bacterium]|nr:hypothetical protein [Hyphomicrobiales bacterium]
MYNTDLPRRADLPTSAQLRRSTVIAAVSACAILVTVVLPAEYAIDPTGVGRVFGLTEMGEIKTQLAAEAEADSEAAAAVVATGTTAEPSPVAAAVPVEDPVRQQEILQRLDQIEAFIASAEPTGPVTNLAEEATELPTDRFELATAPAPVEDAPAVIAEASPVIEEASPVIEEAPAAVASAGRSDEVSFTLAPGQGAEIKLVMRQGARVNYTWSSAGGTINFDAHGDAPGQSVSYEKGRGVDADDGVLEAAFEGNHGWFWRNRGESDVTVTLRTDGDYIELKRLI